MSVESTHLFLSKGGHGQMIYRESIVLVLVPNNKVTIPIDRNSKFPLFHYHFFTASKIKYLEGWFECYMPQFFLNMPMIRYLYLILVQIIFHAVPV